MFPRSAAAPRGRPALLNEPPPPPTILYAPRYFDYSHQNQTGVNSFNAHGPVRLPPYEWKPPPSTNTVHLPHRPVVTNGRKRQNEQYTPHAGKRQRLDFSPHPSSGPLFNRTPPPLPPPHRSDQAVAETSTSSLSVGGGLGNHSCSSPDFQLRPVPVVPESHTTLQAYAKDRLSVQMVDLFEACRQQPSDLDRKEVFRIRLQQEIQRIFATARLYLTGSSMSGLGCRSSDADLCLVIRGNKRPDPICVLSHLQRLFRTLSYVRKVQLIRAKVPILRFTDKDSDLEFDLNINNTVGIRNTFLLRSYAHADIRIRPMILVVKKWARHHQINDASKGTLSSYTLVLMVLHYLQTLKDPVLPCLQRDYPEYFNPLMDIDVVPERSELAPPYFSKNQSSLGELLLGFLRYYARDYRWDKQVISVREARALPKTNSHEWRNKYICVEEPFERNNVARAVHEQFKFNIIKAQFAESYRILQDKKDLNSILPVRSIINKESFRR